ncbi:RidA family protein [Devosia sp.]|uniref:RidA family protein n=1 Tax=Devosia sp. TaxID=1871048 RepID=UPI002AFED72C|nr:RidA family protein [Devosia sp.]
MSDQNIRARLQSQGIVVPTAVKPVANYTSGVMAKGSLLFLSGQGTRQDGIFRYIGKVGEQFTTEEGAAAARLCALNVLAQIEAICGLDAVRRVVKLTGFVNAASDFTEVPAVLNGASDLMVAAFGADGVHARSAMGVATLPFGMAVEVEAIIELKLPIES